MRDFGRDSVWKVKVNTFLAILCVGTITLGAWFMIWRAVYSTDPITEALAAQLNADSSY